MAITARIRVVVATLAIAGMGIASLVAAPPASAEPAVQERADTVSAFLHNDACGPRWGAVVPDSGVVFNFHEACHWHDWCYAAKPYGASELGRDMCDSEFYVRMGSSCHSRYPHWYQNPLLNACISVAASYYTAVRAAGGLSFWSF
jgi:hypothetical protein